MKRDRKPSMQTLMLLRALRERPRAWCHGYDLSIATGLKSGTLYPILMRLGDRGMLEHKWQESPDPGRPPRHMYRLSAEGIALCREQFDDRAAAGLAPQGSRA